MSFESTRCRVLRLLESHGLSPSAAADVAGHWLINGDFLLASLADDFDVAIGNPPYVRQELIPPVLLAEYRTRYATIYDRADLYVPFIERSLRCLVRNGQLGFICADRWMKNRYGGPLRRFIAKDFKLKIYVDMVGTPAFHSDVIAYPAITIISRSQPGPTRIARQPHIESTALTALTKELLGNKSSLKSVRQVDQVTAGDEPWILESANQLGLVRRLENSFPTIEAAGCKVGIGVATGADKVFIGPFDQLDVEEDRKLPLAMTRDILTGHVQWGGFGVLNPFSESGRLVNLQEYPKLGRYLMKHEQEIGRRHVARKAPSSWYRTIDRIYPELARTPKLLIPDIKGEAQVVYEGGRLYPHHNLYYLTSDTWNLKALQAVLLSGIARLFVSAYSTKMRGGYLRFQAQYLRRIRIPPWEAVSPGIRELLIEAAEDMDAGACNRAVIKLYELTSEETAALEGTGA